MSAHPNKRFLIYLAPSNPEIDDTAGQAHAELIQAGFVAYWDDLSPIDTEFTVLARSDALFMPTGWKHSNRAAALLGKAQKLGIPVFYDIDALKAWAVDKPYPEML